MQHSHADRPVAARPIQIDVDGEPLGVVVPHVDGFRFIAVTLPVFAIDGQIFESVDLARAAASAALEGDIAA